MTSTTTNYGWTVPTSSDLVKNGATAISTVGQSVDTFLFRPFSKNVLINGGYDIWQRSTSYALTSTGGAYGAADRWSNSQDGTAAGTASQITSSLPTGFRYGIKIQRTAAATTTGAIRNAQVIETANSVYLAGQTVTLSFYAKAGANFSAASSVLNTILATGTGTDQSSAAMSAGTWTGYAGNSSTYTLTTSWQRFTYTVTLPSTITQAGITFYYVPVGTAGADDSVSITGIQLEIGSQATPFSRNAGTIQGELAACQRYYARFNASGSYSPISTIFFANTSSAAYPALPLAVPMRANISVVDWGGNLSLFDGVNRLTTITSITPNSSVNNLAISSITMPSSMTTLRAYRLDDNGAGTAYIGFGAEL